MYSHLFHIEQQLLALKPLSDFSSQILDLSQDELILFLQEALPKLKYNIVKSKISAGRLVDVGQDVYSFVSHANLDGQNRFMAACEKYSLTRLFYEHSKVQVSDLAVTASRSRSFTDEELADNSPDLKRKIPEKAFTLTILHLANSRSQKILIDITASKPVKALELHLRPCPDKLEKDNEKLTMKEIQSQFQK